MRFDKPSRIAAQRISAPFVRLAGNPASGFVLLCDHASNRVPDGFENLGLAARELDRHIAYDPGASGVTFSLAEILEAPAILSNFSRLVIDPNRGEGDPTLIMRLSDGAVVPGNVHVDDTERRRRIERYHAPYHTEVTTVIDELVASGAIPALVSIHSFAPVWRGRPRPWHVGVLWDQDPRLARLLIEALGADSTLIVGDNEPYSGALAHDTLYRHGTRRGLAHALIEIRQDLIADETGVAEWAHRLAHILRDLNQRNEIHEVRYHGSRTGAVDLERAEQH